MNIGFADYQRWTTSPPPHPPKSTLGQCYHRRGRLARPLTSARQACDPSKRSGGTIMNRRGDGLIGGERNDHASGFTHHSAVLYTCLRALRALRATPPSARSSQRAQPQVNFKNLLALASGAKCTRKASQAPLLPPTSLSGSLTEFLKSVASECACLTSGVNHCAAAAARVQAMC
jgi:hypothetical protein